MSAEELTDGKVRQRMFRIDSRSCRRGARFQRHLFFVRINPIKHRRGILTVDIVINKPLARVELASRFSVN